MTAKEELKFYVGGTDELTRMKEEVAGIGKFGPESAHKY